MLDQYIVGFWGLLFILFTLLLQTVVATIAHRKQTQYVPGIVNDGLGHHSFVFRSHRTFQNSLENVPLMFSMAVLAILVGLNPVWLAATVWTFAIARFIHMILYYAIATERNPSPRSLFFAIALLSNLALLGMTVVHLA